MAVMPSGDKREVFRIMLKVQIVDDLHRLSFVSEREITVGREEQVGLQLVQKGREGLLKPCIKEKRVPGRGELDQRGDVVGKDELVREIPVEKEEKMVLGVLGGDPLQRFKCEPPDAFKLVFEE